MSKKDDKIVADWLDEVSLILDTIQDFLGKREQFGDRHMTVKDVDADAEQRIAEWGQVTSASTGVANLRRLLWLLNQLKRLCRGLPNHPLLLEAHAIALLTVDELRPVESRLQTNESGLPKSVPPTTEPQVTDERIR